MTDPSPRPRAARLWVTIGVASLVLLASHALEWSLLDWLTPFLLGPWFALVWLLMLGALMLAVRHAWRRPWRAWLPALACVAAMAFSLLAPFERWWLWADFHGRLAARKTVIAAVQAGRLVPNVAHNPDLIALHGTPQVSAGGNEVVVEHHRGQDYVFFYTDRGLLDHYAGYLWVGGDADPRAFDAKTRGDMRTDVMSESDGKGRWYYITHR